MDDFPPGDGPLEAPLTGRWSSRKTGRTFQGASVGQFRQITPFIRSEGRVAEAAA